MLDAGCGEKPYSLIYNDFLSESIGCDVETYVHNQKNIDVFSSIGNLPFEADSFNTILCTNVLERVAEMERDYSIKLLFTEFFYIFYRKMFFNKICE